MVDSYEDVDSGLLAVLYVDRIDSLLILLQAWESLLRMSPSAEWSKVELCYGGHQFADRMSTGCRQTEIDRSVFSVALGWLLLHGRAVAWHFSHLGLCPLSLIQREFVAV